MREVCQSINNDTLRSGVLNLTRRKENVSLLHGMHSCKVSEKNDFLAILGAIRMAIKEVERTSVIWNLAFETTRRKVWKRRERNFCSVWNITPTIANVLSQWIDKYSGSTSNQSVTLIIELLTIPSLLLSIGRVKLGRSNYYRSLMTRTKFSYVLNVLEITLEEY